MAVVQNSWNLIRKNKLCFLLLDHKSDSYLFLEESQKKKNKSTFNWSDIYVFESNNVVNA